MQKLVATRLIPSPEPRATANSGPGYNESPPSPCRPPESSPPSPGGSCSTSNHRASRLSAAARSAARFLVGFAVVLALPLQAQAQSKILVSNVGLPNNSGSGSLIEFDQAQAFTTGSNSDGYTLRSVEIDMGATNGEYATVFTVSIHSNSSGTPGASLGTLSNPASVSRDGVYAFTTRGIALAASTTYFVVIDAVAISGVQIYINNTSSNAQDPGKAPGWSIGDSSLYRNWNSSGSWTSFHDSKQIRVKGYNPTVSNATIEIADASAAENAGHLLFEVTLSRALRNTVKVDFETISGGTATEGVDYHARRTYTHVILAGDRTAQMGFALIEDTVNDVDETVKAKLSNAREVDAYGNVVKLLNITTAEATGTITAPPTTTTNVPNLTIGIQDATGDEDDRWLLFKVKLSKKSDDLVCYDFEAISGGTATEGTDYHKIPKATYWMAIGKKVDKPFVLLIDDSVNDNGETVKVKISNAHLCNDASQTLAITRAEATGTIRNSDPLPRALLARFGRTAAVHVVEHVEERLQAPREPGFGGRFGGRELRQGMERDIALDLLSQLGPSAGVNPIRSGMDQPMTGAAVAGAGMARSAGLDGRGLLRSALGGGDLLTGSGFALNRATHGGIVSVWSRGAQSSFSGREGALSLGGDVRTTMFGADYARGPLVAGLSLSHSRSLGEYAGVSSGQTVSEVTGLYPWLGYRATDRITIWGVAGYGSGGLSLTPQAGPALESDLSVAMAAAGTRGELVAGGAGGFGLAFKADALWVGTTIDGVDGPAGRLAATEVVVTRFRTALEGSRAYTVAGRVSLKPSVEVGLRHDAGDAETGAGMDVGAGLVVSDTLAGLSVDLRVRTLLVHQAAGFRDRGMALSLSYNPTPATPLGLMARVAPSWGGQATSGAQALWGRETMAGMPHGSLAVGNRLDAEVGYGLPVGSRFVGTPRFGVARSGYGRDYRLGYSLAALQTQDLQFELGVDAQRGESLISSGRRTGGADQRVLGRVTIRW